MEPRPPIHPRTKSSSSRNYNIRRNVYNQKYNLNDESHRINLDQEDQRNENLDSSHERILRSRKLMNAFVFYFCYSIKFSSQFA
jgi:hypothetical protein